jgi:hypothetical protein
VNQFRHPEAAAKRPSKDAAEAPGPSPFEARRFAPSTFRVTGQSYDSSAFAAYSSSSLIGRWVRPCSSEYCAMVSITLRFALTP